MWYTSSFSLPKGKEVSLAGGRGLKSKISRKDARNQDLGIFAPL